MIVMVRVCLLQLALPYTRIFKLFFLFFTFYLKLNLIFLFRFVRFFRRMYFIFRCEINEKEK